MADNLESQLDTLEHENEFLKKYLSLRRKCEQLQQSNEKIVNRIQHVKKLIKKQKREKRFLVTKLEEHGDSFEEADIPLPWEEDQIFNPRLRPNMQLKGGQMVPHRRSRSQERVLATVNPILAAHGLPEIGSHSSQGSTTTSKSKKRSDKEKNPSAPKKPANAFLMFCQQQRTLVQESYYKEKNEEISNHELTKRIAHQWNGLSPDQKKVYYDMYEQEKERYDKEVKEFQQRESTAANLAHQSEAVSNARLAAMAVEAQSAVNALMMDG